MKRQVLCSLVLTGLLSTGVMFAQEPGSAPEQGAPQAQGGGMGMHGGHHMDPDQMLAHMTKRYNLTADQQSQIKPILQDQQQQMQSLRSDTSSSREDKMAKMQSMHRRDHAEDRGGFDRSAEAEVRSRPTENAGAPRRAHARWPGRL